MQSMLNLGSERFFVWFAHLINKYTMEGQVDFENAAVKIWNQNIHFDIGDSMEWHQL